MGGNNAMDEFIQKQLNTIEQCARKIVEDIREIYGYCDGHQTVVNMLFPNTQGNGYGNQTTISLTEEIKQMIVELKIKGSVRTRENGLIEFRSQALGSIYGRTKSEIEQKLTQKLKEVKNKKHLPKNNVVPLFSAFFNDTYLPYKKQTRKESSVKGIISWYKFIIASKLDKPLNRFTAVEIEKFLFDIPLTRKRQCVRGVLNNVFTYAKQLGIIKSNPCDNVSTVKHEGKQGTALSFLEQKLFFQNLFSCEQFSLQKKLYYTFVYLTGTRRKEALQINIQDVDFENNILHIAGTKTKTSNRDMPLFPLVKLLLLKLTPNANGNYFTFDEYEATHAIKRIDSTHHLHELRHTFGTIKMCVDKLDAKTVSLYMGHSTVAMTLSTYTHPEQLSKEIFYNGGLTEQEKVGKLREEYNEILSIISEYLS